MGDERDPTGFDDEGAVQLLLGALARPSPSGAEAAVANYLRGALEREAPDAAIDAVGNVTATFGTGPRRITLLGHIDTVPGEVRVRREGGIIHGRGAVDAKGPFCAMAVAASRLSRGARSALSVRLVGAVEEEAATSRGARHEAATREPPDFVVIGEPSGWDAITLGYKGRAEVRIAAAAAVVHSARDEATPPEVVVEAWLAVRDWARERSRGASGAFDAVGATLLEITSADDAFEAIARARIALRLPPSCPPEQAEEETHRTVSALATTPVDVTVTFSAGERAHRGPRDTPLTRAFRTAIRARGGTPRLTLKTGTSDMNVVAPRWPVPMVAYGPGDAALDHTPHEHVVEADYLRSIEVLTEVLERLAAA